MNLNRLIIICIISSSLASCSNNRWNIDTSTITINQQFKRFDKDLFAIPHDSIWQYVPTLEKKYDRFFELYNTQIIRIGGTNQLDYDKKLLYFLTDPDMEDCYAEVQKSFPDLFFKDELNEAFKRYHSYFPEKPIPDIYTHVSGFNQSIVVDSGYISISLDKYLEPQSKFYQMLRTPQYLKQNMRPEKITSDVIYALALTNFPFNSKKDDLIAEMIYYGQVHVFMDALLPVTADTLKWGYTEEKLKWCKKNEKQIWLYLVDQKLLFSSSHKDIMQMIDEGPFTSPFGNQSADRTGQWLGYQIVNSYLKHHPEITLPELMQNNQYQQILNESKYKP